LGTTINRGPHKCFQM